MSRSRRGEIATTFRIGTLVCGTILGIGIGLIVGGQYPSWLPLLLGAPASGIIRWLLGRPACHAAPEVTGAQLLGL